MEPPVSTREIYDSNAAQWERKDRVLLSDFTARSDVINALAPLSGAHVLDIGCAEGYVARLVADAGTASVFGIDISNEMIQNAQKAASAGSRCPMTFVTGDAAAISAFPRERFDRIMAVFSFNYMTLAAMTRVLHTARERLAPGGRLVFVVPHPCFPFMRAAAAPYYFNPAGYSYFDGIDVAFEGGIWRLDGRAVPVRCLHKTFSDYFAALANVGFTAAPKVIELKVTEEHIKIDKEFFSPLRGYPLHVLFSVSANAA